MAMEIKGSPVIGITGGYGFIGNHLIQHFKRKGISFVTFEGNLLHINDIDKFFDKNNISTVIHLVGTMDGSFKDLIETNVVTTQNLLKVGVDKTLKKLIFASTGAVYGQRKIVLSKESDMLLPSSLYGLSKVLAEEVINYYQRESSLTTIILRFSNVYGKDNKKNVIAKMIGDIQAQQKVSIAGDGEQRRQFLHVDDAVEAITASLQLEKPEVLNITNEEDNYSINELATLLQNYFSFEVSHASVHNTLRNLLLQGEKAKKEIQFMPSHSLHGFLKEVV